jgi:hypothetical protein
MNKELEARFDLRVNKNLKDKFIRYCKSKKLTLSDAGRDALMSYVYSRTFVDTMIINLQNPPFFKEFNSIYFILPEDLRNALNNLLAPEEEKLIKSTPPQLLNSVNVITDRGQKALKKIL